MRRTPKISDTEWEIMRIVWAHHPITAADIIERLIAADSSWHPKTARTLLARLVEKQALDYEERGRAYVYEPRVTEAQCVAAASGSFVDRVFGGSLKPMLAHFIEQRRLSREELDELRALLERPAETPATTRKKKGAKS
jgi:BlaI family transcriptional regulator, penicillinase repressor